MGSFLQLYSDFKVKLNRDLSHDEMMFLQWVFERYEEEKKKQSA